jgi:hypothetical protein
MAIAANVPKWMPLEIGLMFVGGENLLLTRPIRWALNGEEKVGLVSIFRLAGVVHNYSTHSFGIYNMTLFYFPVPIFLESNVYTLL